MCGWCGLRGRQKVAPTFSLHPTKLDQLIQMGKNIPEEAVSAGGKPAMAVGPYAEVDNCLRGLAGAAESFGNAAIGGLHGEVYYVTSLAGICTLPTPKSGMGLMQMSASTSFTILDVLLHNLPSF